MGLYDHFFGGTTSTGDDGKEHNNPYGVLTAGFTNGQMEDSHTGITGTNIHSMVNRYRMTGASEGQITEFIGRLKRKYNC